MKDITRKPTIKDVAREAGVSPTTASYAFNDSPLLPESTKQRVRAAGEKLGYQPNLFARNLRRNRHDTPFRTGNIGFVTLDRNIEDVIYMPLIKAFSQEIQSRKKHPIYLNVPVDKFVGGWQPLYLRERNLDGFLLTGILTEEAVDLFQQFGIPFVILGNYNLRARVPMVKTDVSRGVSEGLDYLFSLGHTDIGLVSEIFIHEYQQEVVREYRDWFRRKGLPLNELWIQESGCIYEGGFVPTERLLGFSQQPTAILVTDYRVACGVMKTLERHGLKAGEDVSVLALSGNEYVQYPYLIDRIAVDTEEWVRLGISLLMEHIESTQKPPVTTLFPYTLHAGITCCACKKRTDDATIDPGRQKDEK